jgi:hypothetical protein
LSLVRKDIVVIVGNYGSGKTEVAVNLAAYHRRAGFSVSVADLDLVNPYFRTREARRPLEALGVRVVLPPDRYLTADLPILDPAVAGLIRRPSQVTILDAGGNDVGATVLASLNHVLAAASVEMLQVVNPFRPFTETVEGCQRIRAQIEAAARLPVAGWIGNAHLMDETTPQDLMEGYRFVTTLAERSGLPLRCVTAPVHLAAGLPRDQWTCPLLPIERQLVPPWRRPLSLTPAR